MSTGGKTYQQWKPLIDNLDSQAVIKEMETQIKQLQSEVQKGKKPGKGKASKKGIAKKKHLKDLPVITRQIHHNFDKDFLKNNPNLTKIAPHNYKILIHVAEHYEKEIHFVHQARDDSKFDYDGKPVIVTPEDAPNPLWENCVLSIAFRGYYL